MRRPGKGRGVLASSDTEPLSARVMRLKIRKWLRKEHLSPL
jgi:hypothetical protein